MKIELELTLRCNRHCHYCNRHCNLFDFMPLDDTDMTMGQIQTFCEEVREKRCMITRIHVMGGEPLLHPQYTEIVNVLRKKLERDHFVNEIKVITNGDKLYRMNAKTLDGHLIKINSKSDGAAGHLNMLVAPVDLGQKKRHCKVPWQCGIALNVWGYWPCGPGGAIARLFGMLEYQRLTMPASVSEFGDLSPLCDLCQFSARHRITAADRVEPSISYVKAMKAYRKNPICPGLKRLRETDVPMD